MEHDDARAEADELSPLALFDSGLFNSESHELQSFAFHSAPEPSSLHPPVDCMAARTTAEASVVIVSFSLTTPSLHPGCTLAQHHHLHTASLHRSSPTPTPRRHHYATDAETETPLRTPAGTPHPPLLFSCSPTTSVLLLPSLLPPRPFPLLLTSPPDTAPDRLSAAASTTIPAPLSSAPPTSWPSGHVRSHPR